MVREIMRDTEFLFQKAEPIALENYIAKTSIIEDMWKEREVVWINPDKRPFAESTSACGLSMRDVDDAEARLLRFL